VANKSSSIAPATTAFVLVFGSSAQLPQGTHLFEHASLGRFALFTVPDPTGVHIAVVNRLDQATIIAVPFGKGQAAQKVVNATGTGVSVSGSPATSSGTENLSPGLSGSRAVRKGAVRD